MSAVAAHSLRPTADRDRWLQVAAPAAAVVLGSPVVAQLVASGQALLAVPLVAALPCLVLLHRRPLLAISGWLVLAQLVVNGDGGAERKVYWVVHRALPLAVIAIILITQLLTPGRRTLPRLGWPELAMAGYLIATLLSVWYHSDTALATSVHVFDRLVAPMALYLIVRLVRPDRRELSVLVLAVGIVVTTQAVIGLVAWSAPGLLPPAWLNREGLRTVGSLRHPNVYGSTMIIGGLLLLHAAATLRASRRARLAAAAVGLLGFFMTFLSFGRANWVAAVPAVVGLALLHPRFTRRIAVVAGCALALLIVNGTLAAQTGQAHERLTSAESRESALSRLPVVLASLRMFEAEPLTGWGYGDFDKYDEQFKGRVGNIVYPDKDHASHNLYLTILAEQGTVGFALYAFPAAWWLHLTFRRWRSLPPVGFISRQLLGVLWLAVLAQVIVSNFANVRVVFGLGLWWLVLGLIATVVSAADEPSGSAVTHGLWGARAIPDHFAPVAGPTPWTEP